MGPIRPNRLNMRTARLVLRLGSRFGYRFGYRFDYRCALSLAAALCCSRLHAQAAGQTAPRPAVPSACPVTLSGTVTDTDGDGIPYAKVTVTRTVPGPLAEAHRTLTGDNGLFALAGLAGAPCTLTIVAQGFLSSSQAVTGAEVAIELMPSDSADVSVTVDRTQLAEAEIHVEEHQHIAGFVPNFYVAYDFHAPPLNKRQKFELAYKSLIDPYTNALNAAFAGIEYADDALPGYGLGPGGYFKRFGQQTGDTAVATLLSGALLPILFRQDPRYFYLGKGPIVHRILYALSTAVIARGDNGKWQPAYAAILGDFGAGAFSNLYYPKSSRSGASITLENAAISIGLDGVGNVVQELVFKHFTPHAQTYPNP